jgi:hypothetical protein
MAAGRRPPEDVDLSVVDAKWLAEVVASPAKALPTGELAISLCYGI